MPRLKQHSDWDMYSTTFNVQRLLVNPLDWNPLRSDRDIVHSLLQCVNRVFDVVVDDLQIEVVTVRGFEQFALTYQTLQTCILQQPHHAHSFLYQLHSHSNLTDALSLPVQRRLRITCLHVWSQGNTNVVRLEWRTTTGTGWLFLSKCTTSLLWQSIVVFATELQCTLPTTVCQSPKLLAASIWDLPDVIKCQFREFTVAPLGPVHLHFLSPYWNSQPDLLQDLANDSKRFRWGQKTYLFRWTFKCQFLRNGTVQIDTYLLTYLLTPSSSVSWCCHLHLPLTVTEANCPYFSIVVSFPGISSSLSSSAALMCPVVLAWQCCHHFCSTCVSVSSTLCLKKKHPRCF